MKMEQYRETFNDGYLQFGTATINRNAARKRIGESFVEEGSLAYCLLSARDEDYQMAESMNASLDLKVKTLFPPAFPKRRKSNLKCVIDSVVYDVLKVDWDRGKRYLYFYLQEVGGLDE